MTTRRLPVTFNENIFNDIEMLAKKQHQSLSKIVQNLVAEALELHEDIAFSKLAEKIENETKTWLTHEEFWKDEV